tara:strand:+ start:2410 stop:2901 length:492 start_codon:yes stop_codon:yes gene_type:complete
MVNIKTLFIRNMNQVLFALLVMTILFVSAALSLIPLPLFFRGPPFFVHFYAIVCFAALLYLPPRFWFCFLLPSLWLDLMLEMFLGWHIFLISLQYGAIFFMKRFLKDSSFLSHWIVFSVSYLFLYGLLDAFGLYQGFLTILLYPLLFNWLVRFFSRFRWMNHG